MLAAQFSLSFGVAAALRFGDLSPAEYRPGRFDDPQLRRLEALVRVQADATAWPPPQRGARLHLRAGGRSWTIDQEAVTGDAGVQPEPAAVSAKFTQYTRQDAALQRWADRLLNDPPEATATLPHRASEDPSPAVT